MRRFWREKMLMRRMRKRAGNFHHCYLYPQTGRDNMPNRPSQPNFHTPSHRPPSPSPPESPAGSQSAHTWAPVQTPIPDQSTSPSETYTPQWYSMDYSNAASILHTGYNSAHTLLLLPDTQFAHSNQACLIASNSSILSEAFPRDKQRIRHHRLRGNWWCRNRRSGWGGRL